VDIKKFNRFLYSYQVSPTNVILCIIENTALVLHVLLEVRAPLHHLFCTVPPATQLNEPTPLQDLYLTYYIPVVLS